MNNFGAIIVFRKIGQHKEIGLVLKYKNVHFQEITHFFISIRVNWVEAQYA